MRHTYLNCHTHPKGAITMSLNLFFPENNALGIVNTIRVIAFNRSGQMWLVTDIVNGHCQQ